MLTQELVNYVKSQLLIGANQDKIKSDLIGKGWAETDVNDALKQALLENASQNNSEDEIVGYYTAEVPIESPNAKVGSIFGYSGIASALIGFFLLPPIFCTLGIIFGAIAISKKRKTLGITTVILSIVLLIASIAISLALRG